VVRAGEHLAGGLEPVLGEGALQAAHDRAADADVGVAPVVGVLGVARPLLGDADAADHPDAAVGDQDLAVRAVGRPADRVGLERAEPRDAHAALLELAGRPRSICSVPIASSRTLTSTPSCARATRQSAISSQISPRQ
jgi:hypothetical protein